jgi:hypothetical protein
MFKRRYIQTTLTLKLSMVLALGKVADELGDEPDLVSVGCLGNGSTGKDDFQCGAIQVIGHLSKEECGRTTGALGRQRLACRDPGGECGILDAALRCEHGRTE